MEALHLLREAAGEEITRWNDAPERTFADIDRAFTEAIALAEKEK